ncbi:5090_t:CDS:2, partial [Paraglomus occultum]
DKPLNVAGTCCSLDKPILIAGVCCNLERNVTNGVCCPQNMTGFPDNGTGIKDQCCPQNYTAVNSSCCPQDSIDNNGQCKQSVTK